jgi:subtilisin family serine protease
MLPRHRAWTDGGALGPAATGAPVAATAASGAATKLPNDPFLMQQFWPYNMIDAPRAWAQTVGSTSVTVAVVDMGARFDHPAVAANFTNDGYNFVTGGNRLVLAQPLCAGTGTGTTLIPEAGPSADATQPDDLYPVYDYDPGDPNFYNLVVVCWARDNIGGHGTHVAGTIGAVGNDGVGTTGLNWNVRIRPVRVLDVTGSGSFFDIAQGILYAAGLPAAGAGGTVTAPSRAAIINVSLGGPSNNSTLRNAVAAATNAGSLIIAAAGNDEDNGPTYPAAYSQVLAVAAVGPDLQLAGYTSTGSYVSLVAPGGEFRSGGGSGGVLSSAYDFVRQRGTYAYYEGTSMATPHVAGTAALVLAANPGLTGAQLRTRLQSTAVHLGGAGFDARYGYGLVNAYNAVNNVTGPTRATYVRVVNATTGDTVRTAAAGADGSFSLSHVPPGSYFVLAGQDEAGDKQIGVAGRRFGWFGATGPTSLTVTAGQTIATSFTVGMPRETKPNNSFALANRLVANSYIVGQVTTVDPSAYFVVQIPRTATYTIETSGLVGACRFGIELDTFLELYDNTQALIATNDDISASTNQFCSSISRQLTAGTYFVRVRGSGGASGQFRLAIRDQ